MHTRRRRIRWAIRGAISLCIASTLLGWMFAAFVDIVSRAVPTQDVTAYWLTLLGINALIWGGGGLFFGAVLGIFASMIWRDDSVLE